MSCGIPVVQRWLVNPVPVDSSTSAQSFQPPPAFLLRVRMSVLPSPFQSAAITLYTRSAPPLRMSLGVTALHRTEVKPLPFDSSSATHSPQPPPPLRLITAMSLL